MARPSIGETWLGAQPKFSEVKLKTDSHEDAEFKVKGDNDVKIKFKTGTPVKVSDNHTSLIRVNRSRMYSSSNI